MQEARQPEKEREASSHSGNEELGLRVEHTEIGGCEAGDCANRRAADGIEEKAQQAANPRRSGFAWQAA